MTKLWKDMTTEERQERLGDPSIDRVVQTQAADDYLIERLQSGQWLSKDDARRARRALKDRHV